jgi:hypothetical protein
MATRPLVSVIQRPWWLYRVLDAVSAVCVVVEESRARAVEVLLSTATVVNTATFNASLRARAGPRL